MNKKMTRVLPLGVVLIFASMTFHHALAATQSIESSAIRESRKSRPDMALQLSVSPSGFGSRTFNFKSVNNNYTSTSIDLGGQYYLPFQKFGVLGVGPTIKLNPAYARSGNPSESNLLFAWAYGANLQYQAKYIENQFVVPTIGFGAERWYYQLVNNHGVFNAWGPTAGLLFDLNILDETRSASLHDQTGISRTYLVTEYQRIQGSTSDLTSATLKGENVRVGLRIEL